MFFINNYINFAFFFQPATFQVPNSQNQVTTTMGGPMGPGMTPQMETPTKDHKFSAMDNMMVRHVVFRYSRIFFSNL